MVTTDGERLQSYIEGWRRRRDDHTKAEEQRLILSESTARTIAERLRSRWSAEEVRLFGSVARRLHGGRALRSDSDIDMAASGIDETRYFEVASDIAGLSPFPIDLVLLDSCGAGLRSSIERDGIPL